MAIREFTIISRLTDQNVYECFWATHDPSYWASSLKNHTWEPNGQVICLKKSTFNHIVGNDVALTADGNHAVYVTATHAASGKKMRFVGVHFDDADPANATDPVPRELEAAAAVALLETNKANYIDFIIGDMNTGVNSTVTGKARPVFIDFFTNGFVDAGYTFRSTEATHPWDPYSNPKSKWYDYTSYDGPIDHITIRGGTFSFYDVFNYNIMASSNQTVRIADTAQRLGSDHFLIRATATFSA